MTLHSHFGAALLSILLFGSDIKIFAADSISQEHRFTAEERAYWVFKPLRRPQIPVVKNVQWQHNPIDAFIQAELEIQGLHPSPPADKLTLLRRVTLDLTGLPPTPEEADAFLADRSAKAFERVVDRLLASPHYGEPWARHWLDLA